MKISVIGSGGWGTALALLLLENGNDVTLWSFFEKETEEMTQTGENRYLKGVSLPKAIKLTSDINCVRGCDMVVLATPSFAVRETARRISPLLDSRSVVISVSKGIEPNTNLCMTQIIEQELKSSNTVAALSGPSHAEEVARQIPTGCVAACGDIRVAERIQDVFMNKRFRVYATDDVIGVELGAALKNVIAFCAGCSDGMGFGDNTKAMLMTRGLTEIARVGKEMGGRKETFAGLAGMGDLIVTCTSMHSRNRRAGLLVGGGMEPQAAIKEIGAVVEGYYAAASGHQLAEKYGVEMPITQGMFKVLYENKPLRQAFDELMSREKKHELEERWV